uniref:RWD domain-containing protein n=2 Tax=Clastoptera arizonana TaxID=38151 RepID=A0A1B6DR73_9HEMI
MDYKEEQNNEIEALDSIYCGEMEILTSKPRHIFTIPIKSDDFSENSEGLGLYCKLKFEYTPQYPEEVPKVEVEDAVGLRDSDQILLCNHIQKQSIDNLGMVMIFTLVSAAQEWLNELSDGQRKTAQAKEEKRIQDEEEAERKRFEGKRVTVESFIAWKKDFELEMGFTLKKEKEDKNKKLTGRELFLLDKSLNQSDLKFLEDGGDTIKVDEALFADDEELDLGIDDLDIDNLNELQNDDSI